VLLTLCIDCHRCACIQVFKDLATRRGNADSHDRRPLQNEWDRTTVNLNLLHHVGVLVQEAQSWHERAVACAVERQLAIDREKLHVALGLVNAHGLLLGEEVFDVSRDRRIRILQVTLDFARYTRLEGLLLGDLLQCKPRTSSNAGK